jgi:tetraprenyl-beta-curcumene synthase
VRELMWGLPCVAGEARVWRARALTIPDAPLRVDALDSFARKRANTDGAALFSVIASSRERRLLQAIVAYETIWDFLDNVSERGATAGEINGYQLHRALLEALDLDTKISAYYRHHPWADDGGYLAALVESSRCCCASLASYRTVRHLLIQEGRRANVGVCNHELDPERRQAALDRWAQNEFPRALTPSSCGEPKVLQLSCGESDAFRLLGGQPDAFRLSCGEPEAFRFELTAAASCSAVIHVLLAMAADAKCDEQWVARAHAAYFPWFSVAVTMLDSYVDQAEDAARGAHSYIAHYPSEEIAMQRVRAAIERSTRSLRDLRHGQRHAVIGACMVAMYASKDSARTPHMRAHTTNLVRAGGPLARALVPVLRLWRIAYGQQSA